MTGTCTADGCARTDLHARQLCSMHYKRWRAAGGTTTERTTGPRCLILGCERRASTNRWCPRHDYAIRRGANPDRLGTRLSGPELITEVEWLLGTDAPHSIANRLGYTLAGLANRLRKREGRTDLAEIFVPPRWSAES